MDKKNARVFFQSAVRRNQRQSAQAAAAACRPPRMHARTHAAAARPLVIIYDMNSSVHCLRVSSGLVTVWPSVFSLVKIS